MNVYLKSSLNPENDKNVLNIFKAGEGMGKSGSFFFFSHDDRFLIKTMTNDDFNAFMKFFKYYFEHVNEFPNSLIARIYGVYQIEIEGMVPVYLLLMGNSKKIDNSYIQKIYDLKGSLIKRIVPEEVDHEVDFKNTSVLKDVNILNLQKKLNMLKFNPDDIKLIIQ